MVCGLMASCLVPLTSAGTGADYYLPTFPYISLFIVVAIESLCIMPMHMIWTYLTMRDYPKKSMAMLILVCVWHLFIGLIVLVSPSLLCRHNSTMSATVASTSLPFSFSLLF